MEREALEEKETVRMEAFSDGVFAFAITLLALNLRDPSGSGVSLSQGLIDEWPAFFAFVTSFVSVLIMWMNHHNMFNYIRKIDRRLMLLNGLLLLFVVLTVFNTSLVANHIGHPDANVAATCTRVRSSSWRSCGTVCGGIAPRGVASSEERHRSASKCHHAPIPCRSIVVRSRVSHRSVQRLGQRRGHLGGRRLLRHHGDDRRMSFPRISGHGPAYENLLNSAYCPELSNSSPGALNRATVDIPSSDRFAVKPVGLSK